MKKNLRIANFILSFLLMISILVINKAKAEETKSNANSSYKEEVRKIENLKIQYPINWFYKEYCSQSLEEEFKGEMLCSITKEEIYKLDAPKLKSLFLHYNYLIRDVEPLNTELLEVLKNQLAFNSKPIDKKFIELKKMIYSREFLKYNEIGCPVINQLPANFPHYREVILEQIKMQQLSLNVVYLECLNNQNLKQDREIAINSINHTGLDQDIDALFQEISNHFSDDAEIIELMIKDTHGHALKYASIRLKDDKKFILKLIEAGYFFPKFAIFDYVAEKFRDDEDIMLAVLADNSFSELKKSKLKNDKNFIIKLAETYNGNSKIKQLPEYLSAELKSDKELLELINKSAIQKD